MASIVKRTRKDGTTPSWFIKYTDGTGKARWEKCINHGEARARKAAVEHELARSGGTWTPATRVTFREAAEAWWDRKEANLRPQSRRNYRSALDHWLIPEFGPSAVIAIKPSDVVAFKATMAAKGKGANTIQAVCGVLRQVLGELAFDRSIPSNPADHRTRGKRPGRPPRKITVPEPEEVSKLIAAARPHARPVLELIAATGLRRTEALRLQWQDVNLQGREIHVRESKTDAGERVVPMFGSARKVLLEQKARSRFKRPQDYVFPTAVGTMETPNLWHDREFLHARRDAGLRDSLRLHDLRHAAVSTLIVQGANILLVSRVAGHATPDVTLRVYAHLFDRDLAEAALKFDPLRDVAVDVR